MVTSLSGGSPLKDAACLMSDSPQLSDLLPFDAILVDVDDTLYDYKSAHRDAIQHVWATLPLEIKPQWVSHDDFMCAYRDARTAVTQRHRGSAATRSRFLAFQNVFEAWGVESAYKFAKNAEDRYWLNLIENMIPNQELIDVLRCYSQTGRPICVVTDMQVRIQVEKIMALDLCAELTHMVSSEEVGVEKPDRLIFERALEKIGLDADKVIMIGDSFNKDIEGAQKLGVSAWQIKKYT